MEVKRIWIYSELKSSSLVVYQCDTQIEVKDGEGYRNGIGIQVFKRPGNPPDNYFPKYKITCNSYVQLL